MDFYSLIKPIFFFLPPETAHNLSIKLLKYNLVPHQRIYLNKKLEQKIFDLNFKNPVGLAAGFDKNAECIQNLVGQNFGFLEFGTTTPLPQKGNTQPRIFRLKEYSAIVNKMGFPNLGVEVFCQKLRKWKYTGQNRNSAIIGVNIGKNKSTENFYEDYVKCLEKVYNLCDYITVNISSPNTPGLRNLQSKENLSKLLTELKKKRKEISTNNKGEIPILVKISPDENDETLQEIAEVILKKKIDGVIISNTSINYELIEDLGSFQKSLTGGISGKPIFDYSTEVLKKFYKLTEGKVPIIGVGGIFNAEDAYNKIKAGASLVQVYTGFIYKGFGLVNEINQGLVKLLERDGYKTISEAVGKDSSD
jgi:dihydroorotate dehydrogenase